MRKLVTVLALVLVLAGVAGATATITEPGDGDAYTQTRAFQLEVAVDGVDTDATITYRVNGGSRERCGGCTDEPVTVTADVEEGPNTVTVYADGDEENSVEFIVDTEAPTIEAIRPSGDDAGNVFIAEPSLQILFSDESGIDQDGIRVTLDGEDVRERYGAEITVDQGEGTFTAELDGMAEGNHTVRYNIPDEHWYPDEGDRHNVTGSWNFTLPIKPVVTDRSPTGTVGASPVVGATLRDPAGVDPDRSSLVVTRDGDVEATIEMEPGTDTVKTPGTIVDGLDDGTYTVRLRAVDGNGRTAEDTWNFTVDTSPPSVDITGLAAGDVVGGTETVRVDADDALSAVDAVTVSIGNATATAERVDDRLVADIDTTEAADGPGDVTVRAVDAAGNAAEASVPVVVDNAAPDVADVTVYPQPAAGGVQVAADVVDAATALRGVRYLLEQDGEVVDLGRVDAVGGYGERRARVRDVVRFPDTVDDGEYALLLRAKDAAGHWSNGYGPTITVDTGAVPDLGTAWNGNATLVRGTNASFTVTLWNSGDGDAVVEPRVEGGLKARVDPPVQRLDGGGNETKQVTVTLAAPDSDTALGVHETTVVVDGVADTARATRRVVVQPVPARQQEIEERYTELQGAFAELNASRRELGLEDGNVTERFAEASAALQEVEELLAAGRYHAAAGNLSAVAEAVDRTESTFTAEASRLRIDAAKSALVRLLLVLVLVGLAVGGYLLVPGERGFDLDEGFAHRPDGKHPVRLRVEAWLEKLRAKLGEEEQETRPGPWTGF